MADLKHTNIYRCGVSARYLNLETRKCSFSADTAKNALDLRFHLASKGGGTTSVLLQIGMNDLSAILEAIANKMPENVGVFSDCASIANKKNLQQLEEARRVQDNEKTRAKSLIEKLEGVEEFIAEKYYEAPAGEDEREASVKDQIEEVLQTLCKLS